MEHNSRTVNQIDILLTYTSHIFFVFCKYILLHLCIMISRTESRISEIKSTDHIMYLYEDHQIHQFICKCNRIGNISFISWRSVLLVEETGVPWFRSGLTKDIKIGICCFSTKYTTLRCKSKDGLAQNQDNVSEWSDIFFQIVDISLAL